jgi:hypothetical protein
MPLSAAAANALAQSAAIAAIVTMLIGYVRPFIEQLPFARPSAPTHDATLRLLNLLLNLAGVLALAATAPGGVQPTDWLPLGIQTLAMAAGSHIIFHTVTSSAGQGAGQGASQASQSSQSSQSSQPSQASQASQSAAAAAAVASAVDSAIAAAQAGQSGQSGQ